MINLALLAQTLPHFLYRLDQLRIVPSGSVDTRCVALPEFSILKHGIAPDRFIELVALYVVQRRNQKPIHTDATAHVVRDPCDVFPLLFSTSHNRQNATGLAAELELDETRARVGQVAFELRTEAL